MSVAQHCVHHTRSQPTTCVVCINNVCSLASQVIIVLMGELFAGHIAMDGGDAMDERLSATLMAGLLHLASVGYRYPENCPLVVLIMS